MVRGHITLAAVAALAVLLTGCSIHIPADPHGTLDRAQGGVLRVGATENPPWVEVDEGTEPTGSEVDLVDEFADGQGADVEWTTGSEAVLMDALDRGELDMVVGGFLDDTPWAEKGAVTFPYTADGPDKHVMIVRMGENRLLVTLEEFLYEEAS
ncbi:transporter substrate-binding domain-containing protein [Microbacterium oryzae]|uniref:transporter substrate-binding domain-containing protein n=1 Tax=Microbacterium oryzae TaxID=743009 RepID=UPI0015643FF4|nr:transporter substrate-binding domain-containing protein [Microbacterium oryzae]